MSELLYAGGTADQPRTSLRFMEKCAGGPQAVIPRRVQELDLSQTSTLRILRLDLGLHPKKMYLPQNINVNIIDNF